MKEIPSNYTLEEAIEYCALDLPPRLIYLCYEVLGELEMTELENDQLTDENYDLEMENSDLHEQIEEMGYEIATLREELIALIKTI